MGEKTMTEVLPISGDAQGVDLQELAVFARSSVNYSVCKVLLSAWQASQELDAERVRELLLAERLLLPRLIAQRLLQAA